MIVINSLNLSQDFKTIHVAFEVDASSSQDSVGLKIYIGDLYLSKEGVDIVDPTSFDFSSFPQVLVTVPITLVSDYYGDVIPNNGGYDKDIFDGVFIVEPYAEESALPVITEKSITNLYYTSMVLCHKVIALNSPDKLNEVNLLYLLMDATNRYSIANQIELCLGAYDRVLAICESEPQEFYDTDVSSSGEGVGNWIINGIYTKR